MSIPNTTTSDRQILAGSGLVKAYGGIPVLKSVSISVREGETHAVIGPNGAGKTTLFKVLSGEIPLDSGRVELNGADTTRLDGFQCARLGVGRTFQVARVFLELTTLANIVVAVEARRRGNSNALKTLFQISPKRAVLAECDEILTLAGLTSRATDLASILPYSDRKRLELAMTLALRPRILMLDEPMAGMSPGDRGSMVELIRLVTRGNAIAMLLTEHDMDVVFALADRVTVMNYGEIIASGSPTEVRSSALVRDIYLGAEVNA